MKTKVLYILAFGLVYGLSGCSSYLDLDPTDSTSDKEVWKSTENAELVVNDFYHNLNYFGQFDTGDGQSIAGWTEALTDEFKYSSMTQNALMYRPSEMAYGGAILTASYVSYYWGNWSNVYTKIRYVNQALYNMKKYAQFSEADQTRLEAEMRFFRAELYFEIVKRYHKVILYDENMDKMTKNTPLSEESACWDFIEKDLEFAGENLPTSTTANGRLTSGAAYAFLSRAMLYAERWSVAKSACEKVLAMGYSLTSSYADIFTSNNSEAILQYSYDKDNVYHLLDFNYAPGGDTNAQAYGTPTQEMVESYEYAGGGKVDWTNWHTGLAVEEEPPYARLEPRFQATILYNGASWKGRTIEPYVGGTDGYAQWKVAASPNGKTVTGYYLRKMLNESIDLTKDKSVQPWIVIRLGEVYLNYAEACYHVGGAANVTLAQQYVDKVRTRVGLPSIGDIQGTDLMAAIRKERKVELAFEGQYYWDMRRWKLAESAFTGIRVHGFKIQKTDAGFSYTYVECDDQDRNFPAKMYQIPMTTSELDYNTAISQYDEWK
jgi:hypothetical protein